SAVGARHAPSCTGKSQEVPVTPERWAQIRQIFEGALERPDKDRAAYLRVVCARDEQLRREVETLLASHDGSGDFMAKPAVDLNRSGINAALLNSGTLALDPSLLDDDPGEYQ